MSRLIYNIGHEGSPVIEISDFHDSIFKNQYRRALNIVEQYLEKPNQDILQIIAFCGDRGYGKTSCMKSVANVISRLKDTVSAAYGFVEELKLQELKKGEIEVLDLIDPSFFDKDHNILELFIGKLYQELKKYKKKNADEYNRKDYNEALKVFSEIKEHLFSLHKDTRERYSEPNDLESLTAAVDLQTEIRKAVKGFLNVIGKRNILISIDDIDLNVESAYTMCEQIRKYLAMPEVIVLIGVKISQLDMAFRNEMKGLFNLKEPSLDEELSIMSKKYLDKFLPSSVRINLPGIEKISDFQVTIKNGDTIVETSRSLKSHLVRLIFKRTRYLFYNNKGGVSPIIPDSLRGVLSLLGLLYGMTEITDQENQAEELNGNKEIFKDYFFNSWTKSLSPANQSAAMRLIRDTPDINLNKAVAEWMKKNLNTSLDRDYVTNDEAADNGADFAKSLIGAITDEKNFSFNVSVGDVFYLLSLADSDRLSSDMERMLFFIRSYYSIRLYETYDRQFENSQDDDQKEESYIFTADERMSDTTALQRLVGGAYFTYAPGTLIPADKNSSNAMKSFVDIRVIKGSEPGGKGYVTELFGNVNHIIKEYDCKTEEYLKSVKEGAGSGILAKMKAELEEWEDTFQLAEFLVFTISRSIYQKETESFNKGTDKFRNMSIPVSGYRFYKTTGYYVFDVMAPFVNLINPEFSYNRFRDLAPGMYEFALQHDFSLLRKMIYAKNPEVDHHNGLASLKSDVTIRNGEVLIAILENVKGNRINIREKGILKIKSFYDKIYESGMKTHAKTSGDGYEIKFSFLKVMGDFIEKKLVIPISGPSQSAVAFDSIYRGAASQEAQRNSRTNAPSGESPAVSRISKTNPLYIKTKLELIEWLKKYIGEGSWKASNVYDRIKQIYPNTAHLGTDQWKVYLPNNNTTTYSLNTLADSILSNTNRMTVWVDLMNLTKAREKRELKKPVEESLSTTKENGNDAEHPGF